MRRFAQLYGDIDATTRTTEKVAAMARYFAASDPADAAWAIYFLSGGRPKRLIPVRRLATWAMEESAIPDWLFEESYEAVGDLAETIALLLPEGHGSSEMPLHAWVEQRILPLANADEATQRDIITSAWRELGTGDRLVWNKLITGAFRVGVAQQLVVRALAKVTGVEEGVVAHRLAGAWEPTADSYARLVGGDTSDADLSRPYPFFLAYALEGPPDELGSVEEWQAEWKWDGIRGQLIRRGGETFLWSRGEELVTERFPEIVEMAASLPDGTVVDGEIIPWRDGAPLPFAQLQRRIGRKTIGSKLRSEVPIVLLAYDLLEHEGADVRDRPLSWRRAELAATIDRTLGDTRLLLSPVVPARTWTDIHQAHGRARELMAEGLMLKRLDAPYGVGRRKGGWWKWKVMPYTVDAVLVYAQAGSGRRASLHTDYTFAVWHEGALVPFAKAYSGLTDAEIRQVDAWVRRNTVEKFGPVRSVKPEQVFELAFEGIQASSRHKSGVAVRFPRILRWRTDKPAAEADTLAALHALMEAK